MNLSNRTLVKIAAWGGVIVSTTGFYLQFKVIDRVRAYDYYKDALKRLRTHAGAVHYLGEPIKDKRFKLSDAENNYSDGNMDLFVGTRKEKFFYHNTLLCLVKSLQGLNVTIDLRNDSYICGKLHSVDGFMNTSFLNAVYCDPQGNEYSFENLFIQGRNIRYVHIPEDISIISAMKKEVDHSAMPKVDRKPVANSRKVKKAIRQHMQTVALLPTPTAGTSQ